MEFLNVTEVPLLTETFGLSLAYDRCRFNVKNNLFRIITESPEASTMAENLKTGDSVTVWLDEADEPQSHSYLNKIDAVGLSVGDHLIADPKLVTDRNRSEFRWVFFIGLTMVGWAVIIFIYRKWNMNAGNENVSEGVKNYQ